MTDQTQSDLFTIPLSEHSKIVARQSAEGLIEWYRTELNPNMKLAILEYFNQLKVLLET